MWVPRPDQRGPAAFLAARKRAALLLPTGAGKTAIAAHQVAAWMFDSFEVERTLIVAPKLVALEGWPTQFRRWSGLADLAADHRVLTFEDLGLEQQDEVEQSAPGRVHKPYRVPRGSVFGPGIVTKRVLAFSDKAGAKRGLRSLGQRVHVCSWDAFPWVAQAYGKNWPYDCVVFDECDFLKDQSSERSRAARHVVQRTGKVTHLVLLGATPNANGDEAVWHQVNLLQPGLLGDTLTQFREQFCVPESQNWQTGQVFKWRVSGAMRDEFNRRVATVAVSVPDSLGIDVLPVEHWIDLPPAARQDYDDLAADLVLAAPRVTAGSEAVLYAKLRQVASGFVYDDSEAAHGMHDAKLAHLKQLLDELGDRQALIAYEFDEERRRIEALLGARFADIRKAKAKDRFMAGKLQFLGVHPLSAGHGVDGLQERTNVIVWTTVPHDRALFDQTNGRLKRPGQEAPTVMAHMLIARATVEERIWTEVLPQKLARSNLLLSAVRAKDSEAVV